MKIFIPTLGREGRQATLSYIPEEWKSKTYLVCPSSEKHDYWPEEQRVDVPTSCVGSISKTRQWIMEYTNDPHIGLVDDDVRFYEVDKNIRIRRNSCGAGRLFDLMQNWLENGDVYCATTNSFMSHEKPEEYFYGKPSHCCFLNTIYMRDNAIRFDALDYFEDFHVPLAVLESGSRLHFTGNWITQEVKANALGGCSINRTAVKNRQAMIDLQKLHPRYVDLKEEAGAKNQTLDVGLKMRISFKKAYDENINVQRLPFA